MQKFKMKTKKIFLDITYYFTVLFKLRDKQEE